MNRKLNKFLKSYINEAQGKNTLVRCGVCDAVTAIYQLDDAWRPICPRHGTGEASDKLLMRADAHLLLDYFFQPDMDNPQ